MRVLLTRPRDDSEAFAARLAEHGIAALIAPLMDVVYEDGPALDLDGVQAVLLTSANGVRALARRVEEREVPVFAVGDATAREARKAGFVAVESAAGDVDDLAERVRGRCDPAKGAVLHVAGSAVAGDLSGLLAGYGFECRREVCYHVETAAELPSEVAEALGNGDIDGVALFSPRSAASFLTLVAGADLGMALANVDAYALSGNVAKALADGAWRAVHVADRPTAEDLLEVVLAAARTR